MGSWVSFQDILFRGQTRWIGSSSQLRLPSVLSVRDRYLKPGGLMLPSRWFCGFRVGKGEGSGSTSPKDEPNVIWNVVICIQKDISCVFQASFFSGERDSIFSGEEWGFPPQGEDYGGWLLLEKGDNHSDKDIKMVPDLWSQNWRCFFKRQFAAVKKICLSMDFCKRTCGACTSRWWTARCRLYLAPMEDDWRKEKVPRLFQQLGFSCDIRHPKFHGFSLKSSQKAERK